MSFATAQYRAATVETVSPIQIVVRLYDSAIRFLGQAKDLPVTGDPHVRSTKLRRAHAIVTELQASLIHSHAPDMCRELDRLYDFVLHAISNSIASEGTDLLASSINVLRELRSAWAELARRNP